MARSIWLSAKRVKSTWLGAIRVKWWWTTSARPSPSTRKASHTNCRLDSVNACIPRCGAVGRKPTPHPEEAPQREERWLLTQFPEYADYARRVRRFITWIY